MSAETKTKRVFHPTLDAFTDVPAAQADSWKTLGWRFTNPGHVNEGIEQPVLAARPPSASTLVTASEDPTITK